MRFKRQKRHRRIVRFYTTCFGFRQPYKVLCDGTFIHHLLVSRIRITPPNDAVSNLLGARAKLFTSKCILGELKSLGESHLESLKLAHDLTIARCDHERRKSAVACIMEIVKENNHEHFFVATMDADLREKLQEIPGVPLMFGLRNALYLEQPSKLQQQFVKSAEQKRLRMTDFEYKMLNRRVRNKFATEETGDSSDANEDVLDQILESNDVGKTNTTRNRMDGKDKPQFKRKKAKGPNPLSCLKKKSHGQLQQSVVSNKVSEDGNTTVKNMNRKRKRSRGGKKLDKADG